MPNPVYHSPVTKLLNYGECQGNNAQDWPDYVQALELTTEHIPELIQMAEDERLWRYFFDEANIDSSLTEYEKWNPEVAFWAPIHAWRALGQLRAAAAVKPLAYVLERWDADWSWEELPEVFGLIGAEAIQPLDELLEQETKDLEYNSKITLASGLTKIAENFPEERDRCVEVFTRHLSHYEHQHFSLNAALVLGLYDLKALEAVPVIEAAYAAGKVDEMFVGSWPRVQVDLGLKKASDFTPEELAVHHTPEQKQMLANIETYLNRHKPSAYQKGLPIQREAYLFDQPPSFKEIAAEAGANKASKKSGFGQPSQTSSKKSKKKKKK